MKKSLLALAGLALALVLVGNASAANLAVSKTALGSMGFGNAQLMSDQDGTLVRGKGVTFAHHKHHGDHSKPNCQPAHHCHPVCHQKPACPPPTRTCFTPPTCPAKVH
jgi:hypothetical protein